MPADHLSAFRAVVDVLFKPGEAAVTLFGSQYWSNKKKKWEFSGDGEIIWLEGVNDPQKLPSFWTLSVPGWYDPEMGNLSIIKDLGEYGVRTHLQEVCLDETAPPVCIDVYRDDSPFIVFEIDNLLVFDKNKTTPEIKKLQREAMSYAFQVSGFPFAVLADSGGKSVHATVRLDDDQPTILRWRQSKEFLRLVDLAWVVFGNYDKGILKESGKSRLVRTPGATRDDGSPQSIIATGRRTTIAELTAWFAAQLSPEAQQEVWGREPVEEENSPLRQQYLRVNRWRDGLMQEHPAGNRGRHWWMLTNDLINAGCATPRLIQKPNASLPYGQWQAAWLWHLSAFVYNQYSKGWFFSHDPTDWPNDERERWEPPAKRRSILQEQLKFEGATDPVKNALVDQMMKASAEAQAQQMVDQLPPVPEGMKPPPFLPTANDGSKLKEDPNAGKKQAKPKEYANTNPQLLKDNRKESPFAWVMPKLWEKIQKGHLLKLSDMHGDYWYRFDGRMWIPMTDDFARVLIARILGIEEFPNAVVSEAYSTVERFVMVDEPWVEYPNAIAFQNGTLYIDADGVEFKPSHDPADRLRSMVPCCYDPRATAPRWSDFVRWALPDPSRASLLQEAFGYTLIPGQPFQSFFMMTGTGSNGKSVVLSVLQALHKDSFETVALANLGGRFSLGTIGRKRLAIDTEAENVTNAVQGEGNSATAILKSWTGGDPVKIERKTIQGWSETINAKYFMSCNKKPRFVDPTKGVWRRLKLLKFEAFIEERQADITLPLKLINQELPGIVNWAVAGLQRLFTQNGFTQSEVLRSDLTEYQIDSDSVALFMQDFMRPAIGPSAAAWFDIRPVHKAYKDRCLESGNSPVSETEFRQRMEMLGVTIGRPGENETVNGCPVGTERAPGPQHWSLKGWRCYHPSYNTQTLMGNYAQKPVPVGVVV